MFIKSSFSTSILLGSAIVATTSASPLPHHAKRTDCPLRMKRQVAGQTTGIFAKPVSSFTVSDLAAFTASFQAGNAAAPPAHTAAPAVAAVPSGQARDSPLPVFTTADFGDFFATTAGDAALAAATDGARKTGIGANVVASFTVSDLKSFTESQALATAAPVAPAAAAASGNGDKVTGIFARPVSSFTVSDLAAFTAGQPAPTATTVAAAEPAATTQPSAASASQQVGIGAKVVGSCILNQQALMDATGAWPEVWGPKTDVAGGAYGAYGAAYSTLPAMSSDVSVAVASVAAASSSRTFVPTTTGIGAKTLASFTTKLDSLATSPSAESAAAPSATAPSAVSDAALAPAAESSASNTTSAADAAASAAQANMDNSVEIPGQRLSVLPIGLGVFGALAGLGLIVVAWVSYERRKYRKQFRDRKTAERIKNAITMRQAV